MEFYKEYFDKRECISGEVITTYRTTTAVDQLNEDVEHNPQWKSEVQGYTTVNDISCILVRWVGLRKTPFKGDEQ
ncbi:hypothetical protein U5M32_06030 [Streptococcus sp. TATVAM-FAB35]|uniref:hypothetical protein n=1 Tax=Streptococcus TaxID=1301 RepID=UPI00397FECFB